MGVAMAVSEFEDAYEDEPGPHEREEESLGEAILNATIRDLEPKPAATVKEMATIERAVQLMLEQKQGAILVEREGRPVGIFTERDLMRRVVAAGIALDRAIEEVMTPEPETLRLDDGIAFALNRMTVGGFRNIPIVGDDGAVVGVLSQREVVDYIVSLMPTNVINLPPLPDLEAHAEDGG
jgi:CBS domain-containing protein